jgi:site-specific DNA-cytosine methylase
MNTLKVAELFAGVGGFLLGLEKHKEYFEVFETKKAEAQNLKAEIDKMVYELYGLSEEEIKNMEEAS